jgi:uncharacterized surface protein with fasciclin (FAS1) repeats
MFRLFGVALPVVAIALGTSAFAQDKPKQEPKPEPKQEVKKEEPKKAEEPKKNGKDIIETAVTAGLKTFSELVIQAGLTEELKKKDITVFAPTDEAFKAMGKDLDELKKPENKAKLADFLKGHVVAKKLDLMKDKEAKPLHGADIKIADKDGKATINGTINVTKSLTASNGTIHQISAAIKAEAKAEPKKEEPKKEEKKADAKKEEPKKEEPKKDEKKPDAKKEEPKKEEPKKDEHKH